MYKFKLTLPCFLKKSILSKKSTRFVIDIVGSILGLLSILLLLLLGRLSMGPINLNFLTEDIESAFNAPQIEVSASIEQAQLVWHRWSRPFEIELVNVQLQKGKNPHWLRIEHVGVSLRLLHLLVGDVSLKQLRIYKPHILLERDESGSFSLGFGETKPDQEFSFEEIAPFLALGSSNPILGKLNDLGKISIIEADIRLEDEKENQSWELPHSTLVLKRHKKGFQTELTLSPKAGYGSFTLGLEHQLGSSRFDVFAKFNHISFKNLIEKDRPVLCLPQAKDMTIDDLLNFFQHWNVPLNGSAHLAFIPKTAQVIEGACNIDMGRGELDLSLAKLLPLPIVSGNLSALVTPHDIELKNASLLSEEMLLHLSGNLVSSSSPLGFKNLFGPGQTLEVQGKVEDLLLDHLAALWPQNLAHLAREWLTQNLRKGTLTEATFSFKGHGEEGGLRVDTLQGTLKGEGAEVTYLKGLPPAQNVKAAATFDKQGFDIKLYSGEVENIYIKEGQMKISGLDTDHEALNLNIKATGPLPSVLDVINHKPLEYASYGGVDPKKTKGNGEVNLSVDFPLLANLQFKDVKMTLEGAFKGVELDRKITDELTVQVKDGDLTVNLTQDKMQIQGKGNVNKLPSNLTYIHFFTDAKPYELLIQLETIASFEDFNRLGFDYRNYGKGPTKAIVTYMLEKEEKSRLNVDLDTTHASLVFPPLEWEKKSGEKGELSFELIFKEGHLVKMKDLKMLSPSYSLKGEVLFSNKAWESILLSEFKGPHTETQIVLYTPKENVYEVTFKGHSVNLEKFLEYVEKEEHTKDQTRIDIKLFAEVDQLRLGEDKIFHSVKASTDLFLQGQDTKWNSVSLRAKAGTGTALRGDMAHVSGGILFDIKPGPDNTQSLLVRANDAGQFLKNLSIYEGIHGGYITIKAKRKDHGPYEGVFKIINFEAKEVPLLARFAALLSPMGIVNFVAGTKMIPMDRFVSDFHFSDDFITVKNGVGKSMALGFTVDGKLDRIKRLFALKGNIIPARFLNSILSNIPIIGSLINGGEGEGLFAIAYTVKGSFDNPEVSLNPLSALAPGFIRKLFQSIGEEE